MIPLARPTPTVVVKPQAPFVAQATNGTQPGVFACPGTGVGLNLYALAYEAARRTVALEQRRRWIAGSN